MIETQLNVFDMVVLGIMALSCLFAFFRGLVREILSLAAWVGAGVFAAYYFQPAMGIMQEQFKSKVVAAAFAAGGLYIVALIALLMLNAVILKSIKRSGETGMLDNMMGLAFGAFRVGLIISLFYFMLTIAINGQEEEPKWLETAVTRPYVEKGAVLLAKAAPDYLTKLSTLQKKAQDQIIDAQKPQKSPADDSDIEVENDENSGYSRASTRQMDRLFESSNPSR